MAFIPIYILVLGLTIAIDYTAALLIERSEDKRRKLYLIISIVSTCTVLFIFKYFNFFALLIRRDPDPDLIFLLTWMTIADVKSILFNC
jgi:hypothetical protein